MTGLSHFIRDLEGTIAQRSAPACERTLAKIADLYVRDAERFDGEQIELFDDVLGRFTAAVPTAAKASLADRLAGLARSPPNVTRALALDAQIVVARPMLARSRQLTDQDLIEAAVLRGPEHMAAICERPMVSELVTDVLVTQGDGGVRRAIAANAGARFSPLGKEELLERSREDDALQDLLGARSDLSNDEVRRLVALAKEGARARFELQLGGPPERPAPVPPFGFDYAAAQDHLGRISEKRTLSEADVASLARKGAAAEAIFAVALLAGLPVSLVEGAFRERDDARVVVIGKANNWSWRTVRALLGMRHPLLPAPKEGPLDPPFDAISRSAARRALLVLNGPDKGAAGRRGVRADET